MVDRDTERQRSRRVTITGIAAAVLAAAVFGTVVWLDAVDPDSLAIPAILAPALAVAAVALGTAAVMSLAALGNRPKSRPTRFVVTAGGFLAPPLMDQRRMAIPLLLLTGPMLGSQWVLLNGSGPAGAVLFAVFTTIFVGVVAFLWFVGSRPFLQLTATGLRWDAQVFRRSIPWEALAPGGPPRPGPTDSKLILATVRPDLVTEAGLHLGTGTPQAPVVSLQLKVHPAFLADAIRWYAEHPEHRAAIGTQAELERLVAALTGAGS
jgi:hypothetical protein